MSGNLTDKFRYDSHSLQEVIRITHGAQMLPQFPASSVALPSPVKEQVIVKCELHHDRFALTFLKL